MLVTIAVCPLWVPRWWEPNRNKALLAALLGVPVVLLYLARRPAALRETAAEYVSFVLLLAVLYVIAGGVHLTGDLEATPLTNTAFLAVGAGLASLLGTTGASMLLIRPLLRTNRQRTRVRHTVVFFIFLVSNVGGLLTPLGEGEGGEVRRRAVEERGEHPRRPEELPRRRHPQLVSPRVQ